MSVIQKIRDKYARWAVVAIALSLLGFIMMDAFASRTSLFGGNSTTLGRINDRKISVQDFEAKVKAEEENMKAQGYTSGETRHQAIENVWNMEVEKALMDEEFEKLGVNVSTKELNDFLFGANPPADIKRGFTDPNTGMFNLQAAQQYFTNLRKTGTPEQKEQMRQYLAQLAYQRQTEKYVSLLGNTVYFPKWLIEKQNTDNSLIAKASFVNVPYSSIADSTVKITDDEIRKYIDKHQEDFEQEEETRSISYISFNAASSAADSLAVQKEIAALKPEFAAATDEAAFLARNGSTATKFIYAAEAQMQMPSKDSIIALSKGAVFGPYLDGNNYMLAKKIDSKILPDSVKCRHILIATTDRQSGQPLMTDSAAKQRADSIEAAIRNGANFDTLETKYSADLAAHKDKGVMTFSSLQIQDEGFAQPFAQFILFDGKPGDKKVIKTQFGWHYIEILAHEKPQPHHKIAYLSRPIVASAETDDAAQNAANLFAGDSRDAKSFNDNYEKNLRAKGVNRLVAADIKPNDYNVQGLGVSRQFVKAIFKADNGDVLQPERVGDNYVVALVTEVNKKGSVSLNKARAVAEPVLRNEKKAAQIKQKLGKITTLEAAAGVAGQAIQPADSLRFNGRSNPVLGYESKVIGAIFNPANKGKVVPEALEGQAGVFVVRVDNVGTTPVEVAGIEEQRKMLQMQARQAMQYRSPLLALRKAATIKDNRSDFY
jgi:peptidyl-prolyl cis-trans isomerase D